ncbi:unnamed protein product [Leuciscus chuanchicus]
MSGSDQPHQGAQAPSHETNTSQLVGVPLAKTADLFSVYNDKTKGITCTVNAW